MIYGSMAVYRSRYIHHQYSATGLYYRWSDFIPNFLRHERSFALIRVYNCGFSQRLSRKSHTSNNSRLVGLFRRDTDEDKSVLIRFAIKNNIFIFVFVIGDGAQQPRFGGTSSRRYQYELGTEREHVRRHRYSAVVRSTRLQWKPSAGASVDGSL